MVLGARALVLGSLLWAIALVAAPAISASSSPELSGMAAAVYAAGSVVCHQRPERSFTWQGRPLPVCARCTGLYFSAVIGGLLALVSTGRRPYDSIAARWLLALCSVPTAVTWTAEVFGLMHPSNTVRAVAAVPLGAAAAWLVVTTLQPRVMRRPRAHAV